ncbi:uncharacterized protein N7446_002951 [Penicillium canescens]|uniref:Monocarboxylate transporter n=1 Tax=Penicillium canescens TaxID=5083 RepID=A0AAD6NA93_PENCN|nr:uncharacterized protein N7446_002951 [Penicillium canescens]KAJ6044757.1 hypothetical protein N7460_006112 [Penicillium canescens]KAJ6056226.1 hypothetical protein N7444_005324 [Penicillium canescens]KAJ6075174.1 hypothetical protein N7446_002951 [Penicillium canescens]KAJ6175817.1 hypothetical protein N7485_002731 [Penicillium canescens]
MVATAGSALCVYFWLMRTLGGEQCMGYLSRLLLIQFNLSWRHPPRIFVNWWSCHISSSIDIASYTRFEPQARYPDHHVNRHRPGVSFLDTCIILSQNLASLSQPRPSIRVWTGLLIHNCHGSSSAVVWEGTQPSCWYCSVRRWVRPPGLQFERQCCHRIRGTKMDVSAPGFCTLAAKLVSSLLLMDRKSSVRPRDKVFNFREYSYVEVILVITWGLLTEPSYIVLLYPLPNYASSVGLSARALLNLGLAVGRLIVGFCSDAFCRINVAAVMTAACGFLCLVLWIPAKTYPVLLIFAITSGTVAGTFWGCVTPVKTEVMGLQRLPSAFSMICLLLVRPTTFAEPIALQIASQSGYLASQIFVSCMFFCGGGASVCALRSWKICEIRNKAHRERQHEFSHGATDELKKRS